MMEQYSQNTFNLIVSVESRKGGVGKTTAALCLARILRERGYAVLFMDLDITGTNAADIANSVFWQNRLHIISKLNKEDLGDTSKSSTSPVNLIELFDREFMVGKQIHGFSSNVASEDKLSIDLAKVNVLGSQIYKTKSVHWKGKETTIERPGILFDDLHAYWLLEFIKHIVQNFVDIVKASSTENELKIAVILDNSPGYVGLSPAIHDWLTDLGPILGKFLIVASLDTQDLLACERAMDLLHILYKCKWDTSRIFSNLRNVKKGNDVKEGIDVTSDQEKFFLRLVTSTNTELNNNDPLIFYRTLEAIDSNTGINHTNGQDFYNDPAKYIAAIINRVPRAIKAGYLFFELPIDSEKTSTILRSLLIDVATNQINLKRMIYYDEYIENQFLPLLRRGEKSFKHKIDHLIGILENADNKLRNESRQIYDDSNLLFSKDYKFIKSLRVQLANVNKILKNSILAIENAGLSHLVRLIDNEWFPDSIVPQFRGALSRFLRESELQYLYVDTNERDNELTKIGAETFANDLSNLVRKRLRKKTALEFVANNIPVEILTNTLSELAILSIPSLIRDSSLRKEIEELFATLVTLEIEHWSKINEQKHRITSIQTFLTQDFVSPADLNIEMFESKLRLPNYLTSNDISSFPDFYKACAYAQARLIDFVSDSRFLILLLQSVIKREMENPELFPFVKGIAEDVIVRKTISHQEAPNSISKALSTAEYFREFDEVIKGILRDWKVPHE
jgi:hypothetical protein